MKCVTSVTHLYYIPIIIAALWWQKKGLFVAVLLSIFLVFHPIFIKKCAFHAFNHNDILRAFMFMIIGVVASLLSEKIAKNEKIVKK